jgi:hypothetical protein
MPCDLRIVLIERRPTRFNIPASPLLSTLRSPAVMHKTAGQGYFLFRCENTVFSLFRRVVHDTPISIR